MVVTIKVVSKTMGVKCQTIRGDGTLNGWHWNIEQRWNDESVRLAFCLITLDVKAQSVLTIEPDPNSNLQETPLPNNKQPCKGLHCGNVKNP